MGAWSHGAWDNDDALDWLADLDARGDIAIREALANALRASQPDVAAASVAVAAADLVASASRSTYTTLPAEAAVWLTEHRGEIDANIVRDAEAALRRVAQDSELAELWAESGELSEWTSTLEATIATLDVLH